MTKRWLTTLLVFFRYTHYEYRRSQCQIMSDISFTLLIKNNKYVINNSVFRLYVCTITWSNFVLKTLFKKIIDIYVCAKE